MKNAPTRWTGYDLVQHIKSGPHEYVLRGGHAQPARPIGFFSLASRCRLAWAVFTGRADALFWVWRPESDDN